VPADPGEPGDTGPDDTGPDDTGPDDTGPDDTGPDDTGPDDTGLDDTGPAGSAFDIAEELMAGFRRTPRGVSARFTSAQAGIVRNLVGQVADLVGGEGAASAEATGPGAAGEGPDPLFPDDLAAMLDSGGPAGKPDDPVLARLFPDAYGDDAEAAGDFRRYTEQGLRDGKVAAARTVLATLPDSGGRIRLSAGDGEAWLRALNDVRLALGVLLGITEDYESELANVTATDPRSAYLQVYDWLTFLQETLVRSLR
jgi:Domain of unknown function (DUF2017)